jgi:alcohol dehydrogenase class IV
MPKELTAHTGMDALAHATEAYVAVNRSDFSDPLALKAIRMIKDNLVKSYHGDKEARDKMHIAQCLAGMAFSNALLGIVHSMAHKSGAVFHIPHGCLNAIYLPVVIDYNRKVCADRYAEIARSIDLPGSTTDELTDAFRDFCTGLNDQLNIPQSLREYGVAEEMFLGNVDRISANAVSDACTGCNPRETGVKEFKTLYTAAFYGNKVSL